MITIVDKAWMAGIFDLKARLAHKNNQQRRTRQTIMYVETKEITVVRRLCELTGTDVESRDSKPLSEFVRRSCSIHCPEAHVHVDNTFSMPNMARWTITGASLVVVHHNLYPYMRVDRGYIEAVREILETQSMTGRGSAQMIAGIMRLQALGWLVPPTYLEQMKNLPAVSIADPIVPPPASKITFEEVYPYERELVPIGS